MPFVASSDGFAAKALPLTGASMASARKRLGVDAQTLWSVMHVETSGWGYLPDRRPKILFERHWFHKLTGGRHDASDPDISHSTWGGHGKGGGHQYSRLSRAISLDRKSALESASWGLGQVMGFNAKAAGFAGVEELVRASVASEDHQLQAMANFIVHQKLDGKLRAGKWADFARKYNGPAYKDNAYDTKLQEAHARFTAEGTPSVEVRRVQVALHILGYGSAGPVDGLIGAKTRKALAAYQAKAGLPATGRPDEATLQRLSSDAGWG